MGYTSFQEHHPYVDDIAVKSDIAIVYGADNNLEERVKQWKEKGYKPYFMTGIAWGHYRDYDIGVFDGIDHRDEAQMDFSEKDIGHGGGVNYMVPTSSYIKYMQHLVKKAIDAEVEAIVIEEPEFWIRGGYSPAFKREWQSYYNEPWQKPHSSEEAAFKSAQLMHHLYKAAIEQIFNYIKEYAKGLNKDIKCYVATHSLINYTHWRIVSPEFSLNDIESVDGYIGQVWTGTARTPNVYCGARKERTFETAFLEYGVLVNMVKNNSRKMWFLADPIEDDPRHSWNDYKTNYEATLIASLMYPEVTDYEVMPWPHRIFCREYPKVDIRQLESSKDSNLKVTIEIDGPSKLYGYEVEKERIPKWYAEQIVRINNMLSHMEQNYISMDCCQASAGVIVSNSMLYQRLPSRSSNNDLSDFYGMSLPLLKCGIPVRPVALETSDLSKQLNELKLLLMSYSFMKPLDKKYNEKIADWVRKGGSLIYLGDERDPYNRVKSWWNQGEYKYEAPQQQLFELLEIGKNPKSGTYDCEEGKVIIYKENPEAIAHREDGGKLLIGMIEEIWKQNGKGLKRQNYIKLSRGPYVIAWVFDESRDKEILCLEGKFIDILDKDTSLINKKVIEPGHGTILFNLDYLDEETWGVLVSSSRIVDENTENNIFSFKSYGPLRTDALVRIYCPKEKYNISAKDSGGNNVDLLYDYEENYKILTLRYVNHPDGVYVKIM